MAEQTTQEKKAEADLRASLYGRAQTALKAKHAEEFEDIITELYEENGLSRRRRLTSEEKAAKDLADILEKYPHLASKEDDEA